MSTNLDFHPDRGPNPPYEIGSVNGVTHIVTTDPNTEEWLCGEIDGDCDWYAEPTAIIDYENWSWCPGCLEAGFATQILTAAGLS